MSEILENGTKVSDRYEILEVIGAGGMGTVYRVIDTILGDKEIALKTLLPEFSGEKSYVERFIRELELMNQVNHANVVRTYDIGVDKGLIYFTMEFVRGISLDDVLANGPMPIKDIPLLLIQISRGLQAIHDAEIIHRDLKPGNIMLLGDGTIKIADFGVARPKASSLTKKNERVGSIWYMAPESWQGSNPKKEADLYSLGILIYEAITGELPFDGETPGELMRLHLSEKPRRPSNLRDDVPAWLEQLTLNMLAKFPGDRPSSAREVIERVKAGTGGISGARKKQSSSQQAATPQVEKQPGTESGTYPLQSVTASGSYRAMSGASGDHYLKSNIKKKKKKRGLRGRRGRRRPKNELNSVFVALVIAMVLAIIYAISRILA